MEGMPGGADMGSVLSANQHKAQMQGGEESPGIFGVKDFSKKHLLGLFFLSGVLEAHEGLLKDETLAAFSQLFESWTASVGNMFSSQEFNILGLSKAPDVSSIAHGEGLDGGELLSQIAASMGSFDDPELQHDGGYEGESYQEEPYHEEPSHGGQELGDGQPMMPLENQVLQDAHSFPDHASGGSLSNMEHLQVPSGHHHQEEQGLGMG